MKQNWSALVLLIIALSVHNALADNVTASTSTIQIVQFQWEHVKSPYIIASWLLLASAARILFNVSGWTHVFPESSLLIVAGLAVGGLLKMSSASVDYYTLSSHVFFIYLLPPIIFDAGYFMPNRALFENFDSVLLFSVVGTIFNTLAIGFSLWGLSLYGWFTMPMDLLDILLFAALISAVDPVAVIAVFEEIHVNAFLFVNVFGEALFNDGVTVVLYNLFKSYKEEGAENLTANDYMLGAVSFVVVALGGTLIGILFAFLVSFFTKYTENLKVLSTVFVFLIPYMSYLTADMLSLSSIIAIATCGMVMKQYVKGNITTAAQNSVKYIAKLLAQSSETVIFLFLGLSSMSSHFQWDTYFVLFTLLFCLLFRTIGVIVQCAFLKVSRSKSFSVVDQFVLSYGGLRGAIAYGLAVSIPNSLVPAKNIYITATIAVIYFTVFLQGITIRPLVNFLKVKREEHRVPTMAESVYNKYLDYVMSGIEDIAGQRGHHSFREGFERLNAKILRPMLMRNEKTRQFDASKIVRAYTKITLEEAMNMSSKVGVTKGALDKVHEKTILAHENNGLSGALVNNQLTATPADRQMKQLAQNGVDISALYSMFNDLLDKKLAELNVTSGPAKATIHDSDVDFEDDYMKQMSSSTTDLRLHTVSPVNEFELTSVSLGGAARSGTRKRSMRS